jgi:hypothetical protein
MMTKNSRDEIMRYTATYSLSNRREDEVLEEL